MTPILQLKVGDQCIDVPLDGGLVSTFLSNHAGSPAEIARALRIGVEVMGSAGAVLDTKVVEKSFEGLRSGFEARIQGVSASLDPRAEGTTAAQIIEAFKGEAAALFAAMDPANAESPMGKLAAEIRRSIHAVSAGQEEETATDSATTKRLEGRGFSELISKALISSSTQFSDKVATTGNTVGADGNTKGDIVISCAPEHSVRIVVVASEEPVSLSRRFINEELRASMSNRAAAACILVVHAKHSDGVGSPVRLLEDGVVACILDPDGDDHTAVAVAYHYARQMAHASSGDRARSFDRGAVAGRVSALMARVEEISNSERSLQSMTGDLERTRASLYTSRKAILADLRQILESSASNPPAHQLKQPIEIPALNQASLFYDDDILEISPVIPVEPVENAEETLDLFAALVSYPTPAVEAGVEEETPPSGFPLAPQQAVRQQPKAVAPPPKLNVIVAPPAPVRPREQRRLEQEPLLF